MTALFIHIVICAFIIHGAHSITRDGMIFGFVERLFKRLDYPVWADPISECTICMASLWGGLYSVLNVIDLSDPTHVIIGGMVGFMLAVAGLNSILDDFI